MHSSNILIYNIYIIYIKKEIIYYHILFIDILHDQDFYKYLIISPYIIFIKVTILVSLHYRYSAILFTINISVIDITHTELFKK